MFRLTLKYFLIICLITLDLFLVLDIYHSKQTNTVLGVKVISQSEKHQVFREKKKIKFPIAILTTSPTPGNIRTDLGLRLSQGPSLTMQNQTQDLLQQINQFRSDKGLSPLSANSETCFFANLRSQEIIGSFNHDGFRNRIDSKTLPYSSYSSVAENIAMNGDVNQIIPGWINSPGHAENLLKDVPYGCVVGNGNYYVFEAWKP